MRRQGIVILSGVGIALGTLLTLAVLIFILGQTGIMGSEIGTRTTSVVWFLSSLVGSAFACRRSPTEGIGPSVGVTAGLIAIVLVVSVVVLGQPAFDSVPPEVIAMALGGAVAHVMTPRRADDAPTPPSV